MASLYTRAANRKRLSLSSMHLLANDAFVGSSPTSPTTQKICH